jgi:putative membrane protein
MSDDGAAEERFTVAADAQTHFSWFRTRLSAERTLMSYYRTAIALIGFGFTIYQFLAKLSPGSGVVAPAYVNAPQWLGLLLIGSGLVFLATGMWDYRTFVAYLNTPLFQRVAPSGQKGWHTGGPLAGALLFIAGAFAFVAVLLRI